jgi:cytochrome b6-f complex iron-sulfur subunit
MKNEITRTHFIKKCGAYCVGGLTLSAILESCASPNYFAAAVVENNRLVIQKSEFTLLVKNEEKQRPFVLVKNEKLEFPICVYKFSSGEYKALYLKCTHQGCEVHPYPDYLVCPCHGSEFSNTGKVLQSPAETDLQQFEVADDGERIIIQLQK